MKIITVPKNIHNTLIKLMDTYENYYIATAWASYHTDASLKLFKKKKNIVKMVVGIHFYQTDPDFIDKFSKKCNVRFILNPNGVFHPKVYLFADESGNEWECLIGSANFTQGGLTKNDELMVHIKSNDNDSQKVFNDIIKHINSYWSNATEMTDIELINYKNIYEKTKSKLGSLKYNDSISYNSTVLNSDIYALKWEDYYKKIINSNRKSLKKRLKVLQKIKNFFNEGKSFSTFSESQRKQVAGLINDEEAEWKWFGSMSAAGKFYEQINDNNIHISNALDHIPTTGIVNKKDYDKFIEEFKLAFVDGGDGIATASRLLAMKRPDYFICLNSQNRNGLRKDFSLSSNIRYEEYWNNLITIIIYSVWWSSSCPRDNSEKQIWQFRLAMLDIIYYQQ